MNIETLCAEYNIDPQAMKRFLDFASDRINKSETSKKLFIENPETAIKCMMSAYTKMVTEISQEIIENKTSRAKQFRDDCYNECQKI